MCIKCEKFDNIKISSSEEIYAVSDSLKEALEKGDLVEIEKGVDEFHPKQNNIF